MNSHRMHWFGLLVLVAVSGAAPPVREAVRAEPEDLARWQWFHRIPVPGPSRLADIVLPPSVFARARLDLGDLRLVDPHGKPIPYALRIRTEKREQERLDTRAFDRVTLPDHSSSVTLDLGAAPVEHNELTVAMSRPGYARPLRLEGSSDGKEWKRLLHGVHLIDIVVDGQHVEKHRFRYPLSRLRYLRVTVRPDRVLEKDEPEIISVGVFRTVHVPAEYYAMQPALEPREPVRHNGAPASAWRIDLGEENVPCRQLTLKIDEDDFSRSFVVETYRPNEPAQFLASGELRRQRGGPVRPLTITFEEVRTRWLRLVVIDHRNPPLRLTGVEATAPARQIVFVPPPGVGELRLYSGNPNATEPHYDFAATLPARLEPPPMRLTVGGPELNPDYRPEPKPWTERWPHLVDAVLALSGVTLLGIMGMLARTAIQRHDEAETDPRPNEPRTE